MQRPCSSTRRILRLAYVAAVSLALCEAQSTDATVVGTVTDPTAAVVASANVTLTNTQTNETTKAVTGQTGGYVFAHVKPGLYSVSVTASGFKQQVVNNIGLDVNQTARVDVRLTIGSTSEQVEVTGGPVLLQTDTSDIGHVITNKQIVDLPLNGRDYLQLARLIPGATPSLAGATAGQKGVSRSINSAGARDTSVSFLLDGVDTNDVTFQTPTVSPSIDAIQEFKVLQDAYSAEFGRGATQILTALKSGTNDLHGSLFEFLRNSDIASRSFFQPTVPILKQNQFGGTFGGPVVIPKMYNGKDKTFFFVNYEAQRIRTGGAQFADVPTPQEVQGDFSARGNPIIYDPTTYNPATQTRQPFPGNIIPADRISKRGVTAASLFPAPNYQGSVAGNNYVRSPAQKNDYDQGNARVDQRLSEKDTMFGRYSIIDSFRTRYTALPGAGNFDDIRGQNAALNWVHVFTPNLVNEGRIGFNRNRYLTPPENTGTNEALTLFGFTNTTTNPVTSAGLPGFTFANGISGIGPGGQFPQDAITQTWQLVENVTWQKGAHSLKFGIDFRSTGLNQIVANNDRGTFTFTGQYTSQGPGGTGGHSMADLLLGNPYSAAAAVGDAINQDHNYMFAFYGQDDWKVNSRLTLNLGLRYEYVTPWKESLNRFTVLDFNNPGGRLLIAGTSKAFVPGQGIVDTGEPAISDSIVEPTLTNFAPRIGFAYRATGQTVIRGGYGIFYDVQEGNEVQFLRNNAPYFFVQNYTGDPVVPNLQLDTLFPSAANLPSGSIQPFTVGTERTPYMQQWNMNIERELRGHMLLTVGYLGSKGTDLLRRTNYQQGPNILVTDPANPTPLAQRVAYPNFSPTVILGTENAASSTYHGFIASLERRYSNGMAFLMSYTFSKSLDDASSSSNFSGSPSNAQCRCDLRGGKGPSAFDIQQRFVVSYSYELPFGKGKRFLNSNNVLDMVVGGWQLNGIGALQSGPPFQINTSGDNANIGTGAGSSNNQRPNVVGDQFGGIDQSASILNRGVNPGTFYFNSAAFAMPPIYRLGNLGRNTMFGPGSANWDMSLFKNVPIHERISLQFRSEFFDIFNQNTFGVPGTILNTPTYGRLTGTSAGGRVIQFGLKLLF